MLDRIRSKISALLEPSQMTSGAPIVWDSGSVRISISSPLAAVIDEIRRYRIEEECAVVARTYRIRILRDGDLVDLLCAAASTGEIVHPVRMIDYCKTEVDGVVVFATPMRDARRHVVLRNGDEIVVIISDLEEETIRAPVRVIREIVLREAENRGAVLMHAACAATEGGAVLVLGNTGAGKSSVLWHLCAGAGWDCVSDDRCLVSHDTNGLAARTFSMSIRLGCGLLAAFPYDLDPARFSLQRSVGKEECSQPKLIEEMAPIWGERQKYEFSEREFEELTGRRGRAVAPVRAVLVSALDLGGESLHLRPISSRRVSMEAAAAMLSPWDKNFLNGWLGVRIATDEDVMENVKLILEKIADVPGYMIVGNANGADQEWGRLERSLRTLLTNGQNDEANFGTDRDLCRP